MGSQYYMTPEDFYSLQMDLRQVQMVQNSHADRIAKIEKRHAEDAALKSVWNSPFPGVLGGTPQRGRRPSCPSSVAPVTEYGSGPVKLPHEDMFDDLDEQGEHLLGSLHLGPTDEEPARRGAASRANSVRFDESALQGSSWNASRPASDLAPIRSGSSAGGLFMERSLSYKSDGRHSSAGISVHSHHSVASGRASSIGLDTAFASATSAAGGDGDGSPADYIEPPPGFLVLGAVPAIVRCWLTTDFASETLLYAGVCSGAQTSTVEHSLLKELGLTDTVQRNADGVFRSKLSVYLTEAIARPATTRTTIPHIVVDLEVVGVSMAVEQAETSGRSVRRSIRVFLGSDALRAHSADVLFSQNQMMIFSSERAKFAVPFARPEDEGVYKQIRTLSAPAEKPRLNANAIPFVSGDPKPEQTTALDADMSLPPPMMRPFSSHGREHEQGQGLGLQHGGKQRQNGGDRGHGHNHDINHDNNEGLNEAHGYKRDREQNHGRSRVHYDDFDQDKDLDYRQPLSPTGSRGQDRRHERAVEWLEQEDEAHSPETEPAPTPRSIGDVSTAPSAVSSEGRRESASGSGAGTGMGTGTGTGKGIWGSWRNAGPGASEGGREGGRESGPLSGYQPAGRSRNMKVLRPQKSGGGSFSAKTGASYEPPPPLRASSMGGPERRRSQASLGGDRARSHRDERGDSDDQKEAREPKLLKEARESKESREPREPKDRKERTDKVDKSDKTDRNDKGERLPMAGSRWESRRSVSMGGGHDMEALQTRDGRGAPPVPTPPRTANPIGGASAFSWMNSGGGAKTSAAASATSGE